MTFNGSGIHDISRVLSVSTNAVWDAIRRAAAELPPLRPPTKVQMVKPDEFWSFVGSKKNQRWTRLGLTASTRRIGSVVHGRCSVANCRKPLKKYRNSRIKQFASDDWQSCQKFVPAELYRIGKDKTQRIERRKLNFRINLKRS